MSCLNTKRCPCFTAKKSCQECKCKNCANPFGKRPDVQEKNKIQQSQRQLDAKGGHAGKMNVKMSQSDIEHTTSKLNIYEKVLLKRLLNASDSSNIEVIIDLYNQHVEKSTRQFIRKQSFKTIQSALKSWKKKS